MILRRARIRLRVQRALGYVCFLFVGWTSVAAMRIWGLRVEGRDGQTMADLRRRFAELARTAPGPLLICGNHLTRVDSALVHWALASNWTYLRRFRLLPWNLPDRSTFAHSFWLRVICYLTKCVPIVREGTTEEKRASIDSLAYLLRRGETVSVFPEGKRSLNGRLDMENFGYGAGQLATCVEGVTVVCVYLRGREQTARSAVPARGDRLYAEFRTFDAKSRHKGLRAARDISVRAMDTLFEMEEEYFRLASSPSIVVDDGNQPGAAEPPAAVREAARY